MTTQTLKERQETAADNDGQNSFILTCRLYLQSLGLLYFAANLSLFFQAGPLYSAEGVLPIEAYLQLAQTYGTGFWEAPSIYWFISADRWLPWAAAAGMLIGIVAALGWADSLLFFAAWVLYVSIVNTGQIFYGYGWETLLCESGFIAIFLSSPFRPFRRQLAVPLQYVWLLRWLTFRIMFGAGMIKLRGDLCWRDLTCLIYHFETQPIPNPLSWYFHHLPASVLKSGVIINHIVELVMPWLLFCPRPGRLIAAWSIITFQFILILSGNLSWLNWITIAAALSALDDSCFETISSRLLRIRRHAEKAGSSQTGPFWKAIRWAIFGLIAVLSIGPAVNLFSPRQQMNISFEPLHLVNSYGAFGSVGRVRNEVVLEGTSQEEISGDPAKAVWREFEFKCKPGDLRRLPCAISPLQLRLDWQIWFAAISRFEHQPWLHRLLLKIFEGDRHVLALFDRNPFPTAPPRYLRARLYRYQFTAPGEPGWWKRELIGSYFNPIRNPFPPR